MKIATAIGPEMNELMAKRLSMEQLEMISGGVEEESDEFIREYYIKKIIKYMRTFLQMAHLKSFETFLAYLKANDLRVIFAIGVVSKPAAIVYGFMSWDEKRSVAERAWNSR